MGRKSRMRLFVTLALPLAALLAVLILLGNASSTTQASTGVVGPGDSDHTIVASLLGNGDVDSDGDTVLDGDDNCPSTYNPGQQDTDSDGQGDVCDSDDDGDGVADTAPDNCPKTYNPGQADMDGDGWGDACDQDADGDGHSNTKEWLYGSDAYNASKTPEHIMVAGTCSDNSDNDGDGLTDGSDPGCNAQPIFDGHLEVHLITHLKTTADLVVIVPPEMPEDVTLVGDVSMITTSSEEYAPGQYEVGTEMVSMDLTGTSSLLGPMPGPIHVTAGPLPSTGMLIDHDPDLDSDFPAESFFDVYMDVQPEGGGGGGGGAYHTEEAMNLVATTLINQLPPPGTDYEPPHTPVYLYNDDGEIVGDVGPGACAAGNCATVDITNLHTSGADKYVDRIELDYADAYPYEGTPLEMVEPGDYSQWIYDLPYLKSQNVLVSVTSVDVNDGPDVPADSRITFLADVPQGCEGRWVTDAANWPYDILTSGGTVDPDNPMDQIDGDPVSPTSPKVLGDGDPTTIESDLHFQTLEYSIDEPVLVPQDLLRFFEFHCFYDAKDNFDDDGDGAIDEDPVDGQDNDIPPDGLIDEDPPGFVFTFYNKIEPKETPDPDLNNNWYKATMMVDSLPNADVAITTWRAPIVVTLMEGEYTDVWVSETKHNNGPQDTISEAQWIANPIGPVGAWWTDSGTSMLDFPVDLYVSSDQLIERQLRIEAPMGSVGGPYPIELINDESIAFSDPYTGNPMQDPDLSNNVATTNIDVYVLPMGGPITDKEVRDVRLDDASGFPDTEGAPLVWLGEDPADRTDNYVYGSTSGDEYDPLQYLKSQNVKVSVISEDWNNGPEPAPDAYVSFLADVPLNCEGRWIPQQSGDILTTGGWVDQGDPMNQLEGQILDPDDPLYYEKIDGDGDPSTIESDLHFQTGEVEMPMTYQDILRFFEFHCWEAGDFTFTFYNKIEPKVTTDPTMTNNWWKATMLVHSRHNGDVEVVDFWTDMAQPIQTIVSTWTHILVRETKHDWGPQDVTAMAYWSINPEADPNLNVRWVAQPGDLCTYQGAYVPCGEGGTAGVPWEPASLPNPPPPGVDSCQDGIDNDQNGSYDDPVTNPAGPDPACVWIDDLEFSVSLAVSSELEVDRELKVHANVAGSYDLTLWNYEYPEEGTWDPNPENNTLSLDLDIDATTAAPQADKQVNNVILDYADSYPAAGPLMPEVPNSPPPRTTEYNYDREYLKSQNVMISVTSMDENLGPDIPPDSYVSFLADIPPGCEGRWVADPTQWPNDTLTEWGTVNPTYPMEQIDGDPVTPPLPKVPGDGNDTTIESDLHFQTYAYDIVETQYEEIPLLRFFEFHCFVDGPHIFTFYNKIEPKTPVDDPDLTNNWWKATMTVFATPNADKTVDDLVIEGVDEIAPDVYKLDVLKSQNVPINITSLDLNLGPQVPPDSYVSFLADIPPQCEGRWADDPDYPFDTHTTNGWIDLGNPMNQIDGDIVEPPTPKVFGDGDEATIESDLHFFTDPYGIVETLYEPIPLTRTFELHCVEDGAWTFTFYNKIEPSVGYVDPIPGNNWKAVQLIVNSHPNADVEIWDWASSEDPVTANVDEPVTIWALEDKHNNGPQPVDSFVRFTASTQDPLNLRWIAEPGDDCTLGGAPVSCGAPTIDDLEFWQPLPIVSNIVDVDRELEITCLSPGTGFTVTLENDESIAFRDPVTYEPMTDPDMSDNYASISITVNCEGGPVEPADKEVLEVRFDDGWSYPAEGVALHKLGGMPWFFTLPFENLPISVKSIERNLGPGVPANAQVSFYADIPLGCEGRWHIDGNNPADILTIDGNPYAPPLSPEQFGTEVSPTYPKVPGNDEPPDMHYESDLHLQTSAYGITEPLYERVEIVRFFEIHCTPGIYQFMFCNKAEPTDVTDPDWGNNLVCTPLMVDATGGDGDGDTQPDFSDNCPFIPNPGQADGDGDGYGDVCDVCPATPDPGQEDNDGDAVPGTQPGLTDRWGGDACDNEDDNDSRGLGPDPGYFSDVKEPLIGTDVLDDCPENSGHDAWPPDFNNSTKVTSGDLVLLAQHYNNDLTYDARYDLNASGPPKITSGDLVIFAKYLKGPNQC